MEDYFEIQPVHCEGNCDLTITSSGLLYTIGSDDMIFRKNLKTNEEKREYLDAPDGSYVTIAANDSQPNSLMIGGATKTVQCVSNMNKQEISHLYKFLERVEQIVISKNGKYMAIASRQQSVGVYNFETKKMVRCRPEHSQSVLSVFMSNDQKYVCSTGTDGYIRIYSLEDPELPSMKFDYKISKDLNRNENCQQILRGMFNPTDTLIACPGKPFLQLIECHKDLFHETYKMGIKHEKEISICHWQNKNVLVTGGLDVAVKIWNYYGQEAIAKIQGIYFTKIVPFENTFYGINHSGNVYKFTKVDKLASQKDEIKNAIEVNDSSNDIEIIEPKEGDLVNKDNEQNEDQGDKMSEDPFPKRGSKSKADKLITCYPQTAIVASTQFFCNNRFLLYNTIGCIIQRTDGTSNSIEVEYHDSKIINKRKSLFTDRQMKYFDLQINRVAYANEKEYGFFGDCFWEHKVEEDEEIQGISLGNEWVAVALDGAILIFDLAGNYMANISFDKNFIAMAAYEDLLAVVYVDSVPMWGCQNLRMNVWNINGVNQTVENTYVAIRPSSTLKAFGFSEQGLIYAQDSKDWVRVYCAHSKQWVDIINPKNPQNESQLKLWIVGMSNYQLFAFKLAQGEFEPTVLPRMLPRKIKVSIPNPHNRTMDEIYINSSKGTFGEVLWKKLVLEHERHRYRTWYRYKFARAQTSTNYAKSASILSEEELNVKENALDAQFIFLIKNLLLRKEAERAYITAKTFIKSERQLRKMMEVFNESELPQLAEKLEQHYDESARLQQYDLAQKLKLKQLQQDMEMAINFKPIDPMNPMLNKAQSKARTIKSSNHPPTNQSQTPSLIDSSSHETQQGKIQNVNRNPFSRVHNPLEHEQKIKKELDTRMQKAILKQQEKKRPTISISERQPTKR